MEMKNKLLGDSAVLLSTNAVFTDRPNTDIIDGQTSRRTGSRAAEL